MKKPDSYLNLIEEIKKMPSISTKSAEKISLSFLNIEKTNAKKIFDSIIDCIYRINKCKECNAIIEGALLCDICIDSSRDESKICIVSDFNNLLKIEKTNIYDGKYFILEFDLKPNVKIIDDNKQKILQLLIDRINKNQVSEILILLDFTISGELTSYFLRSRLKKEFSNIKLYRPGIGMPINSSIDYIDNESLEWSIKNKKEF